ncbi:MAG: RNA polymerase sigma factor [Gemmatimonadota bacterium]
MNSDELLRSLLESHGDALWRVARAYAGSEGEEEDLHQEILGQVWRALPSFRGESAAGTWMYRVALNTALTWKRRSSKHSAGRVSFERSENGVRPSRPGSLRTEQAILEDFLETLRGPDRSVIVLYMEGLSYQEIADVTGLSVSHVGVRLHRMKQSFTERYVEE